jgi:hypothetical protein
MIAMKLAAIAVRKAKKHLMNVKRGNPICDLILKSSMARVDTTRILIAISRYGKISAMVAEIQSRRSSNDITSFMGHPYYILTMVG